jgi:K+-sensing histidine kinase KdpD
LKHCLEHNVSLLVLGKAARHWWRFNRPDVIGDFMRGAPGINLHVVDLAG